MSKWYLEDNLLPKKWPEKQHPSINFETETSPMFQILKASPTGKTASSTTNSFLSNLTTKPNAKSKPSKPKSFLAQAVNLSSHPKARYTLRQSTKQYSQIQASQTKRSKDISKTSKLPTLHGFVNFVLPTMLSKNHTFHHLFKTHVS